MATLYWMCSQRDLVRVHDDYRERRFARFARACDDIGLGFEVIDVDDLVLAMDAAGRTDAYLRGAKLDRRACIFHSAIDSAPAYMADTWRHLVAFSTLEVAGFCLTAPPMQGLICNDTLLTLARIGATDLLTIPTFRVMTRQFGSIADYLDTSRIAYPVAVTPAGWASGPGILRAGSESELNDILRLAGADELSMLIQPWLPGHSHYRVYCAGARPVAAVLRRTGAGTPGTDPDQEDPPSRIDVPGHLVPPARRVAAGLAVPYVCVDFVSDGQRTWLSGIDIDAAIPPADQFGDVVEARFRAYHDHWQQYLG